MFPGVTQNKMMRKEKRKSATVCLAATVLLTCCLVQTTDCYRLKKTERRNEPDAATKIGVQEGTIVFGKAFQRGSGLESYLIDGSRKASSNDSVEDETAYQADFVGWAKGQTQDVPSKEAAWKHLAPTLQCMKDQMKFRAVGPAAAHLLLEQGHAPPIPLSHVPSTCGYNVQKNSMALVMLVPYNGCNVVEEGGSYVLPMRWKGIPVILWCPKPAHTTPAPQYTVPKTLVYPPVYPPLPSNHKFPPFYFFSPHQSYPKYPVVVPDPPENPEIPKFPPYPPFLPYFHYLHHHPTTTAAPTKTPASVKPIGYAHHHILPFPLYPNVLPQFPWHFPGPPAADPTVPTHPAIKPQLPVLPPYIPVLPQFPFHHPHIHQSHYPKYPLDMTTAPPTTTEAPIYHTKVPPQWHYQPPNHHYSHPHHHLHSHHNLHGHPHHNLHGHPHLHGHPSQIVQYPSP